MSVCTESDQGVMWLSLVLASFVLLVVFLAFACVFNFK